jgi:hypothetical protein
MLDCTHENGVKFAILALITTFAGVPVLDVFGSEPLNLEAAMSNRHMSPCHEKLPAILFSPFLAFLRGETAANAAW